MFGIGQTELLIALGLALLLFGGKKIPELLGGLGKGVKEFKKGMNTDDDPAQLDQPESDSKDSGSSSNA